jgi:hypothetical protein
MSARYRDIRAAVLACLERLSAHRDVSVWGSVERWVTALDAELDLLHFASLN